MERAHLFRQRLSDNSVPLSDEVILQRSKFTAPVPKQTTEATTKAQNADEFEAYPGNSNSKAINNLEVVP